MDNKFGTRPLRSWVMFFCLMPDYQRPLKLHWGTEVLASQLPPRITPEKKYICTWTPDYSYHLLMKTVIRSNYSFILPLYRLWNELHSFNIVIENKLSLMAYNMISKEFVGFYITTNHIILIFSFVCNLCDVCVCI